MGRATAALLASEGAKVVVADIDETGATETVSLIVAAGGEAVAVVGDTSVNKDVQQIVGTALSTYGRIDALHNNAGILRTFASIEEHSEEVWRRVIDVNLTGYFLMSAGGHPPDAGRRRRNREHRLDGRDSSPTRPARPIPPPRRAC